MCGIIGVVGKQQAAPRLVDSLRRLEYRGYDSSGIATLVDGEIHRRRAEGKIENLATLIKNKSLHGTTGIGHTRWATHGRPTTTNAHPHTDGKVAIVHNGIIENFLELRKELMAEGHQFETDTDTEAVVHLVSSMLAKGQSPQFAMTETLKRLEGAFALAIIFSGHEDFMIGARRGSPLAVGYGDGEMFLGSDAYALAKLTDRVCYLEENDWVEISDKKATLRNRFGKKVRRKICSSGHTGEQFSKGNFAHFMLKEIYDQPAAIGDTLSALVNPIQKSVNLPELSFELANISRVTIIACGTSYYAGLIAKYWLEQYARVPVECDIASEFRYRELEMEPGGLTIFISQSGETADTLAAMRYCREHEQLILAVVNVAESSMAREADALLLTYAGPEIGVASTKAFTTQLIVLACFSISMALEKGRISNKLAVKMCSALTELPSRVNEVLNNDDALAKLANDILSARDVLYLGRGTGYPIALEGALKLKEISYIHAEGYAAGEMKHGPIALIDECVPVIIIAPSGKLFDKTSLNMQEVLARGGRVILLSDQIGIEKIGDVGADVVELPQVHPFVAPILYTIPVQLLAYHTAVLKGNDVDQPRNLAKSVTVE